MPHHFIISSQLHFNAFYIYNLWFQYIVLLALSYYITNYPKIYWLKQSLYPHRAYTLMGDTDYAKVNYYLQ